MAARKRELIEPHKGDRRYARRDATGQFTEKQVAGDRRYARRDATGQFTEKQVAVGRSLAADRRSKSKTLAKKG